MGKHFTPASQRNVYFVRPVGFKGPIKIGSAIVGRFRRRELEAYSPFRLELLLEIPGGIDLERRLHRRFAYAHSHSEWFHPVDELVFAIEQMLAGIPVEKAINLNGPTHDLYFIKQRQMKLNTSADEASRLVVRLGVGPASEASAA